MPPPRSQPPRFAHSQPPTYSVTLKSVLSLPFRLCNPPPAVGKVRSCGVTPLIHVRLEDVLNRQHLPPLGLKDFEEWLLFVEMSPENLYFILWLREYKQRYLQWQSQTTFQNRAAPRTLPLDESAHYSTHLAMFYARAKQTFFTPGSAYELNLASTLLAPFHRPTAAPYPPPDAFRDVELETYRTLDSSLRRFVHAQLNNVGNSRVLCGMIAGVVFCLLGAALPLAVLFARHDPRWARLAAFPGLWLGLTVLLASLNGICLGVYVFGDLRQLRKFELARPPISKPQLLPANAYRPIVQAAAAAATAKARAKAKGVLATHAARAPSVFSLASRDTAFSAARTEETDSDGGDNIHISPAYYDADSIEDMDPVELYAPNPGSMEDLGLGIGMHYQHRRERERDVDVDSAHEKNLNMDSAVDLSSRHSINTLPRSNANVTSNSIAPSTEPTYPLPPLGPSSSPTPSTTSTSYTATATFIHPFDAGLSRLGGGGGGAHAGAGGLGMGMGGGLSMGMGGGLSMGMGGGLGVGMGGGGMDDEDEEEVLARAVHLPARHQVVAPFDFEGLPVHPASAAGGAAMRGRARGVAASAHGYGGMLAPPPGYLHPQSYAHPQYPYPYPSSHNPSSHPHSLHPYPTSPSHSPPHSHRNTSPSVPRPPEPAHASTPRGIRGLLARMQERTCGLARWRLQTGYLEARTGGYLEARAGGCLEAQAGGYLEAERDRRVGSERDRRVGLMGDKGLGEKEKDGGLREKEQDGATRTGLGRRSSESEKTHVSEEGGPEAKYHLKYPAENLKHSSPSSSSAADDKSKAKAQNKSKSKAQAQAKSKHKHKDNERTLWKHLRAMRSVPAFAVPLARVLSPVVVRGQWEIVVRSGAVALVVAGAVVGGLLAVPVL